MKGLALCPCWDHSFAGQKKNLPSELNCFHCPRSSENESLYGVLRIYLIQREIKGAFPCKSLES